MPSRFDMNSAEDMGFPTFWWHKRVTLTKTVDDSRVWGLNDIYFCGCERLTCPCRSVLSSITAHVSVSTDPVEESTSGLHCWKRVEKCCRTLSRSWVSPVKTTSFRNDLRTRKVWKATLDGSPQCVLRVWKRGAYRNACSRLWLVKSKNLRYSSPVARLNSLLSKETANGQIWCKNK